MDRKTKQFRCQVQKIREQIEQGLLAFTGGLSSDIVQEAIDRAGVEFRERIYTPWVTLWLFLYQIMARGACADAVSHLIAHRIGNGQQPCSPSTTSYCEARSRLPKSFYHSILVQTGGNASQQAPTEWKFHGRDVKVGDGTTVSMPETDENCEEFPLQDSERAGLSFPLARILVLFSLSVGTVLEAAISPYRGKRTGEYAMLRTLVGSFQSNDVFLADRGFCSFCHIVELHQRGVDSVVKLEETREGNLTFVKRLAKNDRLFRWRKPIGKPETFTRDEFNALPDEILVRLVTVKVDQPGFRVKQFDILTTLTNHKQYPSLDLADLYRRRWQAELFLRDIKVSLGMDRLRCESPEAVYKEIYAHLIAYNLVRIQIAQAAYVSSLCPQKISFTTSLKTILRFRTQFQQLNAITVATMLATIAYHQVGRQPDRTEPRAIKRRPKHDYLTVPRQQSRNALLETSSD